MKKIISVIIALALTVTVFAQTTEAEGTLKKELTSDHTGWKKGGVVNVNFSQAAFSSNWASGGTNTMTLNALVSVFMNFSDGVNIWDNNLDLGYGFTKIESDDPVKSEDKIDLTSKYGRKAFQDWYYAGLFNFKSQMTPTEDAAGNTISEFMSPGAVLLALGMDYKPGEIFTAFISPLTMKSTFIKDVDTETNIGGYARLKYKQEIWTNVSLESKFEAFSNYQKDEKKDLKPQNIDLIWTNLLSMKVNEYLSANFSFEMAHDDNVDTKSQFKEVLGIGLAYKF